MRDIISKMMHPERSILLDPNKHLVDSINTSNVKRIKSALNMPCVDLNIRIRKHQQMTILMRFCYLDISSKSRKDLVHLVLDASTSSCDLDAQDLTGKTVLAHACIKQDVEMIRLIAKDGMVDPEIADDDGNTPLMHAVKTGNANVVETMVGCFKKYGLDVNKPNKQGMSPLLEAARVGNIDVIRTLVIEGDADVNQRDKNRNCAQDYLVLNGNGTISDLLLLNPAAQRKRKARERRVAEGRKSMMDLVNEPSIPRRAWISEDGEQRKSKFVVTKAVQPPLHGLSSCISMPLSKEYTGQLNSVVFQLAQCIPMLEENPLEEDRENDAENAQSLRLKQRRRSSSLSDLKDLQQQSMFNIESYFSNGNTSEENELSPRKVSEPLRRLVSKSQENLAHDGRLRLQPIFDGSTSPRENGTMMKSRNYMQRRSSMPVDLDTFGEDREEQPPARRSLSFSRDIPKPSPDEERNLRNRNERRGSLPLLSNDNTDLSTSKSKSSIPTSPRVTPSPSKSTSKPARRLSDPMEAPPEKMLQKVPARRSSLPHIDAYNNQSLTSARPKPQRRSTYPANIVKTNMNKKAENINIVHRPRGVESRVSTSWEGKSSKSVPSYLFR